MPMLGLLIRWALSALALVLTSKIVPGIAVTDFTALLIAAVVLGLVNAIVRPILVLFTLPITILTVGLFLLVVNAITFGLAAWLVPGFSVNGFFPALFGSIVMAILSSIFSMFIKVGEEKKQS
jgi:putative membrane protein